MADRELEHELRVVFEDEDLVVLDKPAELMVHQNEFERHEPTCLGILQKHYGARFFTVHRLDRKTSGLLVFARSGDVAGELAKLFRSQAVEKRYLALVHGRPQPTHGTIDRPLEKRQGRRGRTGALTRYRVLADGRLELDVLSADDAAVSILELELVTGRQHQARLHARALGAPIVGDRRYGHRRFNHVIEEHFGVRELFLQAAALRFLHPTSGKQLEYTLPTPASWTPVLQAAGLDPAGLQAGFKPLDPEALLE